MYKVNNKKFLDIFNDLCYRNDRLSVFYDFVKMSAISIYNSFAHDEEMEKNYLSTIKKYTKNEQNLFTKLLAELILLCSNCNEVIDILGTIYMEICSKDKHLGQVFTPRYIAEFMASLEDEETIKKQIEKDGYISMSDPTCGSGRFSSSLCK